MGIILDSGTIFETDETALPAIAYLDDTHFVVAYREKIGFDYKGKVVCGSTSGVTPTFGTIVEFSAVILSEIKIARLDATHFVIAYSDAGDGKCRAGSISGTTITLGSVVTFESSQASYIGLCGMDATHFVVAYQLDSPYTGVVIGASVSGVTITFGAKDAFASITYSAAYISICGLSSTHFVIAYKQALATEDGIAVCGTLSGNTATITEDGGNVFDTSGMVKGSISALDATHFVIAYTEYLASYIGKVIAGSVSGTTVTIVQDGASTFETGYVYGTPSIAAISASSFAIAFCDATDSYKGKVIGGKVSGTTITIAVDTATTFESGSCAYGVVISSLIDGLYYAIAFVDGGDSAQGKAILGSLPAVRQGVVDISASPSISAGATRKRYVVVEITSAHSLSAAGTFIAFGGAAITAIPSLILLGGTQTPASVSIVAISSMIIEWRVIGRCSIAAVSSLSITGNRMISAVIPITAIASLVANGTATLSGMLDIGVVSSVAADGIRAKYGAVTITAVSSAEIAALAYVTQSMGYSGTLIAGDVLVIDVDEQTVELNGVNATRYFTGKFPQLYAGTNELQWKDDDGTRDANFETKHEPRYL